MEGNKDEAIRCKILAKNAIGRNDFNEALRLLDKSNRMYPCDETKDLLKFCIKKKNENVASSRDSSSPSTTSPFSSTFNNESTDSSFTYSGTNANKNSKNDSNNVNNRKVCSLSNAILNTCDYYKILNVEKNATDDQIKKAYRKLALQLHPDKNKFPEAEEAFKKVAKAFQCLTNPQKRRMYDQYGMENAPQQTRTEYDADLMTAEELFQAFFGVDLSGEGNRRIFRHVRRQQNNEQQHRLYTVIQLLPIFLLLFITFLTNFFQQSPKPLYSFDFNVDYPVTRVTRWQHIEFYVSKDFDATFPKDSLKLRELEMNVEISYYQKECGREEQEMLRQIQMARYYGSVEQIRAVQQKDRPNCRKLQQLRAQYGRHFVS